ncbi:CHASE domain-containing protein [Luteimonas sp. RD2P54]|uniref:histidine kinase n=1 Tax=Luteimonas endophytica TaxID=3042023 RepID=A0ABT6J8L2_9GAMM|nr:CHASE domain-containing protein [Luteimonas endophytica]MDH5823156.1 CHASE domain-containing protein [Luteimonas endophytica]
MGNDTRPTPEAGSEPLQSRRGFQLAWLVLVGSLLMVFLYAQAAGKRERQLAGADFIAEAGQIVDLMRQRLLAYELTVRGGASLFGPVDRPSARQWQAYVDGLRIERRGFALTGLGYAAWLTPQELEALQMEMRAAGRGLYRVDPHGARQRYGPIVYLEPGTPANLAAIGYDMYADPTRRAAMDAARDSGTPRLSAGVRLVQQEEGAPGPGLVLYMPVYRAGSFPANVLARRASMQGWVYTPFEVRDFVESSLAPIQRSAVFRIVDLADESELYVDPGYAEVADSPHRFRHSIEREIYGRNWRIDFRSAPDSAAGVASPALRATLAAGVLASLLLFAVVWTLARTHSHAQRLAARMSESYRRSELRFRSAMEYSAIGKALLDREDRVVEANPALARILGVAPAALPGTGFGQRLLGGDTGRERPDTEGVVRATRELRRPDGELRHVQLTYAPVPGDIGSGVARLVQVEDVTERLRAEAQVHALNRTLELRVAARTRELRQANQEMESFAYSVSHDLRAPLRSIDGFGRMLAERHGQALDETGRDYVRRIRAATARMDGLIDALLKMSRLSRAELKRGPVDLSRMAGEIVAELRHAEPEREVEVEIAPGLAAVGDPALLRNLLENLLGNAWKFSAGRSPARLEFGAEPRAGGGWTFFVRDNGAGFAQEYASKLFRPFQRLHGQEEFPGHGIGLASVKRIVDRHGGEVHAEGRPGQGACFRFTLPEGDAG